MKKTSLYKYNNIKDDLLFWLIQFLAPKVYSIKEKKSITKEEKDKIYKSILESSDIDVLRGHIRVARSKGLYNLPDYLNPLYKLYMYILDDNKIDDIKKINTTYINVYVEVALAKNTSKTQQLHYDQIRSLFKFIENNNSDKYKFNIGLLRSGKRATSPVDKTKQAKQTFLEPRELVRFIDKLKDLKINHPNNFQTRVMIKILCYGGLRKEELANLKFDSYSLENLSGEKYMRLLIVGKGSKERLVYIKYSLIKDDFKSFVEIRTKTQSDSDCMFITRTGTKFSLRAIEDMITRAFKNTGFGGRGLTVHSLRRSYSTALHAKGKTIEEISKLLGHSREEFTELYTFVSQEKKYEVVDLLDKI